MTRSSLVSPRVEKNTLSGWVIDTTWPSMSRSTVSLIGRLRHACHATQSLATVGPHDRHRHRRARRCRARSSSSTSHAGAEVRAGQQLMLIESMKMHHSIDATVSGVVGADPRRGRHDGDGGRRGRHREPAGRRARRGGTSRSGRPRPHPPRPRRGRRPPRDRPRPGPSRHGRAPPQGAPAHDAGEPRRPRRRGLVRRVRPRRHRRPAPSPTGR